MANVPPVPTFDDWSFELVNLSDATFTSLDANSIIKVAGWVNQGATAHRLESAQLEISANSPGAAALDWDAVQLLRIVPYADAPHELWGYLIKDKERYTERGVRDAIAINVVPIEYLLHSRIVYETNAAADDPEAIAVSPAPNNTGGDFAKEVVAKCMLGRFPTGVAADSRAWSFATLAVTGNAHDGSVVPAGYNVFEGYLDELINALGREYAFVWELRPTVAAGVITFTFDTDDAGATDKTSGANKIIINDIGAMVPAAERYYDRGEMVNALHNRGISTAVLNAASITDNGRWEAQSNDVKAVDLAIALEQLDVKEGSTFDFEAAATADQVQWMGDLPGGYEAGDLVLRNNIILDIAENSEIINGLRWSFPDRVLELEIRWGNKEPGQKKKQRGGKMKPAADVIPGFVEPTITFSGTPAEGTSEKVIRSDATLELEIRCPNGPINVPPVWAADPGLRWRFFEGTNLTITGLATGRITWDTTGPAAASFVAPAFNFGAGNVIGVSGDVVHSDSVIALGITCDDANTVYPDAGDNNEWDILGGTGASTVGAVANTVTINTVWDRGDFDSVGATIMLRPTTSTDPVLIGAATTDATAWVATTTTFLDVRGLINVARGVYSKDNSLALWGVDAISGDVIVHVVDERAAVGGAGGSACILNVFDAAIARAQFDTALANPSFIHGIFEIQDAAGAISASFNGVTGAVILNEQGLNTGHFRAEAFGETDALAVDALNNTIGLNGVYYAFPAADGAASTFLMTNGAAALSWTDAQSVITPGTLTVATANVTGPPHTHAITSSSNPGAAASILATSVTGALSITGNLDVADSIRHIGDVTTLMRFTPAAWVVNITGTDTLRCTVAGVIVNQGGDAALDFRCEADTNDHAFFVDATGAGAVEVWNSADIEVYSDAGASQVGLWDGATGSIEAGRDANVTSYIGRAAVGYMGTNDRASFAHVDFNTATDYAVLQFNNGRTVVNTPTGLEIQLRINNVTQVQLDATTFEIWRGIDFFVFSDAGVTPEFFVDGATGETIVGGAVSTQLLHVVAGDVDVDTGQGYRVNNTATLGNYLRGDGARFVDSALQIGDLPAHDILSVTHGDTLAAAVSRGSIIVGNLTPLWSELVIGAANTHLESDGTDATWVLPDIYGVPATCTVATGNVAGIAHTHAITTSSNPGAVASILASTAAGGLTLVSLTCSAGVQGNTLTAINNIIVGGTVDGVDVAAHTHGVTGGATGAGSAHTHALSGETTGFAIDGTRCDGINPVREVGGTIIYLRTFANAADAGNDVNATGEICYIGSAGHHHELSGTSGDCTTNAATAAAANESAHTHGFGTLTTGAPL